MNSIAIIMLNGIPKNPAEEAELWGYLKAALSAIRPESVVLIGGGHTDPGQPNKTEAQAAHDLIREKTRAERVVRVLPWGQDARDVLEHMKHNMKDSLCQIEEVTIVCLYTHQDLAYYHAHRLFGNKAHVIPIGPRDVRGRIKRLPRTALGIMGTRSRKARAVENALRELHILVHSSPVPTWPNTREDDA